MLSITGPRCPARAAVFPAAFLFLAACGNDCRPVEPIDVTLAGESYTFVHAQGARVLGDPDDAGNDISTMITGSGKDRRNTYCIVGPSETPAARLLVFDGEDAAAIDPRFAPLASLSQVAILAGSLSVDMRPDGTPGPLPGMIQYDGKKITRFEAREISGWPAPVEGHCSPATSQGKRSCRIYAALTPDTYLTLDLYSADIQSERWAEYFALTRDLFATFES